MEDNLNLRWKTVFCLWHFSSQILLCAKVYFFSGKFGSWWLTFERFPLEDILWWALTTQLCCWSLANWRLFPSAELLECLSPLRSHFMDQSYWSFCCDWVMGKSEHSSGLETWRQTEFKSWGVIRNEQDDNIRSTHAESIPVCHNCCRYSNCLEKVILFSFNERKHKVMWNKTKKAKIMATQKNNASRAPQNSPLNCGYFFWHSILFGPCVH